ncbi:hypothetical protein BKA66DRAFT_479331 [Pyrenochaeta sp. MPI-SDFR-AT-0127]|nr:hypothetical protein BKA66DRAFT_479331 [Pyrenochaeta sp. MPI-SDFR-AT-0127]
MKSDHRAPYSSLSTAIAKLDLREKSALITGGGYGIGSDIARSFAECGISRLVLVGRTEARLRDTAESLQKFKETIVNCYIADISVEKDVQTVFSALDDTPDYLVNSAGYLPDLVSFIDADLNQFRSSLLTNVLGTAQFTQAFLRHRRTFKEKVTPAVVITLNTVGALSVRVPRIFAYASAKAGLARLSELVSVDVPESEARFICVHPGAVKTDMGAKFGLGDDFPYTEGKLVGDFVVWLTSSDAEFLSGRFVWAKWDVDDLVEIKDEIQQKDLLRTRLSM